MLRRLHPHLPASFAFTRPNAAWAQAQKMECAAVQRAGLTIGTMDIVFGEVDR